MGPERRGFLCGLAAACAAPSAIAQVKSAAPLLNSDELKKILDTMAASGAVRQIGNLITGMLGAAPEDEPLSCVMLRFDEGKETHAFAKLQDNRGYILSFRDKSGASRIYFADNALKLVSALDEDEQHGLDPLIATAAQSSFNAELTYWARKADADFA